MPSPFSGDERMMMTISWSTLYTMQTNRLRVSIVIPAYNEESYLPRCLDALAAQTVAPFEVIVVDNNSTDRTAAIAATYPFVRLVRESRQGVVFARDRGFHAARGDIIGRIDADTVLSTNWVRQVQTVFGEGKIDAVTGKSRYYDIAFARLSNKIEHSIRRRLMQDVQRMPFLQGANMAITRRAWHRVCNTVCRDVALHEDFDLSIHVQMLGMRVHYDERLVAALSARRTNMPFATGVRYILMGPRTYAVHDVSGYQRMYMTVIIVLALYGPLRLLFRGYHPETRRFSLLYALRGAAAVRSSPLAE
jgi:glycosyltransferase involved in cell wall biosynthesis